MKREIESDKISACAHCGGQAVFVLNDEGLSDIALKRFEPNSREYEYYLKQDVKIRCKKCRMSTMELVATVRVDPVLMTTNGSFYETGAVKKLLEMWNNRVADLPKEGKWEKSDIPGEKYVCSICGGACWYYDCQGEVAKSRFCPSCGAKMKDFK